MTTYFFPLVLLFLYSFTRATTSNDAHELQASSDDFSKSANRANEKLLIQAFDLVQQAGSDCDNFESGTFRKFFLENKNEVLGQTNFRKLPLSIANVTNQPDCFEVVLKLGIILEKIGKPYVFYIEHDNGALPEEVEDLVMNFNVMLKIKDFKVIPSLNKIDSHLVGLESGAEIRPSSVLSFDKLKILHLNCSEYPCRNFVVPFNRSLLLEELSIISTMKVLSDNDCKLIRQMKHLKVFSSSDIWRCLGWEIIPPNLNSLEMFPMNEEDMRYANMIFQEHLQITHLTMHLPVSYEQFLFPPNLISLNILNGGQKFNFKATDFRELKYLEFSFPENICDDWLERLTSLCCLAFDPNSASYLIKEIPTSVTHLVLDLQYFDPSFHFASYLKDTNVETLELKNGEIGPAKLKNIDFILSYLPMPCKRLVLHDLSIVSNGALERLTPHSNNLITIEFRSYWKRLLLDRSLNVLGELFRSSKALKTVHFDYPDFRIDSVLDLIDIEDMVPKSVKSFTINQRTIPELKYKAKSEKYIGR